MPRSRFQIVERRRPVDLVAPLTDTVVAQGAEAAGFQVRLPQPAPYAAAAVDLAPGDHPGVLRTELSGDGVRLTGRYDSRSGRLALGVTDRLGVTTQHRSRRYGRAGAPVTGVALTLTGDWLTVWSAEDGAWTARGRVLLRDRVDTHDEAWLGSLQAQISWVGAGPGPVTTVRAGGFGQLGLRDLRFVTDASGEVVREGGHWLLTASSAGPGFFDTGHTSVWSLDRDTLELVHRADLFFRRPDRPGVFGDHATHLVRDGGRWLVATSTWGDFQRRGPQATVAATLAESAADLTRGRHVLDTRPLPLPVEGLRSVGVWDPYLVRTDDGWLVAFVSATRFFRFHPALAHGPDLDRLTLRAADTRRRATEGVTLLRLPEGWRLLASDGRAGRPGQRERFPVLDLDLREVGALDAPYPTNLPWPTVAPTGDGWVLAAFNGRPYGGPLPGYGTHGEVVLMRTRGELPVAHTATDRVSSR